MSKYTTELRYICETFAKEAGLDIAEATVYQIVKKAAPEIFDFNYPIFKEEYKILLEIKILKHFYTREICAETYARWRLFLDDTMNTIMPYYNKLYESELLQFNPFEDVNIIKEHNGTKIGNEDYTHTENIESKMNETQSQYKNNEWSANGSTDATDWDKYSETPQGGLANIDPDNSTGSYYLTNVRKKTNDTDVESNGGQTDTTENNIINEGEQNKNTNYNKEITNMDDFIDKISGKTGKQTSAKMLKEFRETFLNIDAMVLKDLETLFMGVW